MKRSNQSSLVHGDLFFVLIESIEITEEKSFF